MSSIHHGGSAVSLDELDGRVVREVTVVRVLLVLTGFATVINGVLEQAPTFARSTHVFGWLLVAFGFACWVMTARLRDPGPTRWVETLLLAGLLGGIRVYQIARFHSAVPATGLLLPALITWRISKPGVRAWLAQPHPIARPHRPRVRQHRPWTALGAVGVTVATLIVVSAAGAVVAAWPCSFPAVAAPALNSDQLGPDPTGIAPPGIVQATDGTPLAYYAAVPPAPIATLVFYHGSGANSIADYTIPPSRELASRYHIATYLFDIRGHGASGGPRGDAPDPQQVWDDVTTATSFVHRQHPGLPEYLGGHSAGAGLVLNALHSITVPIAGYAFLAPALGLRSNTQRVARASNFATVCRRPFLVNALSNHLLDGHTPALGFAYTSQQIHTAGMVDRYTVNMALAQNPDHTITDLRGVTQPIGIWTGTNDEVFDPTKITNFVSQAAPTAHSMTVPNATHLGIDAAAADLIGPWITTHTHRP